jgi:arabinan endo-1,5-alpha-L-arabinosidase
VANARQVAIDNRYEGSNVIHHGRFFYLFVSATNCCNGELTAYSVFAGRSRNPLGPYVDREGNSLLDPYVGGTPVISMNGNKWIGTGHNTVFQDFGGQWWTIYHAVNRFAPYFAGSPGFTRRPALLDAVDWVRGWPTVNGGRWASSRPMPAPAAQPGERSRHRVVLVAPQRLGVRLPQASDNFNGTELGSAWTWVRKPPDPSTYAVHDGMLSWQTQAGDLYVDNNTASVLMRRAPARSYVVTTKLRVSVPPDGVHNYVQGGLVIYADDDNFIKLADVSIWDTRQTEYAKELAPVPDGWARYGNTVIGPPSPYPSWTYLRIVVQRLTRAQSARTGGDTEKYTGYSSQDGLHWVRGGTWTHHLGRLARIGLISMGGTGYATDFDYVHVRALR